MTLLRRLGSSEIQISVIGLGCWQFSEGTGLAGRYWPALSREETAAIVEVSLAGGINWFDTAEMYGGGRSEQALALALKATGKRPGEVLVATKWWPALRTARHLKRSIDERLRCLGGFPIDLYQIHQPFALSSVAAQMDAMAELVLMGKIRTVGVSNFSAARMRAAHQALARRGMPLVANQMRYSLVDRRIERNGVLAAAKELGITIIAYSPLGQGLLSGKYHRSPEELARLRGPRRLLPSFRRRGLQRTTRLVQALQEIAAAHDVTPSQVALSWVISAQGDTVVAIPGASTRRQAEENVGAMRLRLTDAEMQRLDELSRDLASRGRR